MRPIALEPIATTTSAPMHVPRFGPAPPRRALEFTEELPEQWSERAVLLAKAIRAHVADGWHDMYLAVGGALLRRGLPPERLPTLIDALGLVKDGFAEAARQAVKVRLVGLAPSDALEPLLRDRNLDVPAVSSDSILRTRIRRAWATWSIAGTKESILTSLADAGYPNASVREGTEWSLPHWWWFYMVLRPPYPWGLLGASDADKALRAAAGDAWPTHAATTDGRGRVRH